MRSSAYRSRLEQELSGALRGDRRSSCFSALTRPRPETVPTGIPEIDTLTGGFPRGNISEVSGTTSSGITSLLLSLLARISGQNEVATLIDPGNALDPISAAAFGVQLDRLLWIRAAHSRLNLNQILKTVDLLVQGGGFGLIGVDLRDVPAGDLLRIPPGPWYRLQRAAENTPTILMFLNREPVLKTTAALGLRMEIAQTEWSGRFLRVLRPEVRIVHSRHHSVDRRQSHAFRLFPAASIEAGTADDDVTPPVESRHTGVMQ